MPQNPEALFLNRPGQQMKTGESAMQATPEETGARDVKFKVERTVSYTAQLSGFEHKKKKKKNRPAGVAKNKQPSAYDLLSDAHCQVLGKATPSAPKENLTVGMHVSI